MSVPKVDEALVNDVKKATTTHTTGLDTTVIDNAVATDVANSTKDTIKVKVEPGTTTTRLIHNLVRCSIDAANQEMTFEIPNVSSNLQILPLRPRYGECAQKWLHN